MSDEGHPFQLLYFVGKGIKVWGNKIIPYTVLSSCLQFILVKSRLYVPDTLLPWITGGGSFIKFFSIPNNFVKQTNSSALSFNLRDCENEMLSLKQLCASSVLGTIIKSGAFNLVSAEPERVYP